MSGSSYLAARDNDLPFRAIPVFLHRRFRHGFMFINTGEGHHQARGSDAARKIGVKTMMTTADAVDARHPANMNMACRSTAIEWVAEIDDDVKFAPPPDLKYHLPAARQVGREHAGGGRARRGLSIPISSSRSSPRTRAWRGSFPITRPRKCAYLQDARGIFPIMHVHGHPRRSLTDEHPWLAGQPVPGLQ